MAAKDLDLVEILLDPKEVRRAAEDVDRRIARKRKEVDALEDEVITAQLRLGIASEELKRLEDVYELLRSPAGLPPRTGARPGSVTDAVIQVLRATGRPMRSRDILEVLGDEVNEQSVRWSLWDAGRRGLIDRVGVGLYEALEDDEEDEE